MIYILYGELLSGIIIMKLHRTEKTMKNSSASTIKQETLENVLRFVASKRNTTRKIIAENCSISLMTAGKAVDFFINNGLFIERRLSNSNPGPSPYGINLNPKYNCIAVDIYSHNYKACVLDVSGKELLKSSYVYNRNIFIDDNFKRFLKKVKSDAEQLHPEYRIGIGLMLPENYVDNIALSSSSNTKLKYIETVSNILCNCLEPRRFCIENKGSLALQYFSSIPEYVADKTLIYICLNKNTVISEAMIDGKVVVGKDGRRFDISKMCNYNSADIPFMLRHSRSPDEYCEVVAFAIADIIACMNPHIIIIDSEIYRYKSGMTQIIVSILKSKYKLSDELIPEFIVPKNNEVSYFYRGMLLKIKNMFIEDVIKKLFNT